MPILKKNEVNKRLVILLILGCIALESQARCRIKAQVRYRQQYGWSKVYTVDVTLISGRELNEATQSNNYSSNSNYATVFWAKGEATVIKLDTRLYCTYEVTCDCIYNWVYGDFKGKDQDQDYWEICLIRPNYLPNCF